MQCNKDITHECQDLGNILQDMLSFINLFITILRTHHYKLPKEFKLYQEWHKIDLAIGERYYNVVELTMRERIKWWRNWCSQFPWRATRFSFWILKITSFYSEVNWPRAGWTHKLRVPFLLHFFNVFFLKHLGDFVTIWLSTYLS